MPGEADLRRLFGLFADLLEYPHPRTLEALRECEALAALASPGATALLRDFRAFVEGMPLARLEEVYTSTFDLDPACSPYLGYHLFGESYKRSVFLLELRRRYRAEGLALEGELPDHLAVVLRFLATSQDPALRAELVDEALTPALEQLLKREGDEGGGPPGDAADPRQGYRAVLRALHRVLQDIHAPAGAQGGGSGRDADDD